MRIAGRRDDARADELNNLRLALATFALQLDAFEMRTYESLKAGTETPLPASDVGCKPQREE
jgi:hypothetical protein